MLNLQIEKIRESEISEVVGEYASYHCGIGESSPTLEVFGFGSENQVVNAISELVIKLGLMNINTKLGYEYLSKGYFKITLCISSETPMFEVLLYAKILSEYGHNKYIEIPYTKHESVYSAQRMNVLFIRDTLIKLGWLLDDLDFDYNYLEGDLKGKMEMYKQHRNHTQITQVYLNNNGLDISVTYRIYDGVSSNEPFVEGDDMDSNDFIKVINQTISDYDFMIGEYYPSNENKKHQDISTTLTHTKGETK